MVRYINPVTHRQSPSLDSFTERRQRSRDSPAGTAGKSRKDAAGSGGFWRVLAVRFISEADRIAHGDRAARSASDINTAVTTPIAVPPRTPPSLPRNQTGNLWDKSQCDELWILSETRNHLSAGRQPIRQALTNKSEENEPGLVEGGDKNTAREKWPSEEMGFRSWLAVKVSRETQSGDVTHP